MGAGRFVGRVGGLAVALGVGAAISLGNGIAWADDTASAGSESAGGSVKSPEASTNTGTDTTPSTEPTSAAEPAEHPAKSEPATSRKRKKPSAAVSKPVAAAEPKSSVTARPARHEDDDAPPAATPNPKATSIAVSVAAPRTVATVAEVVPAAPVVAESVGVVSGAVVDSSLLGGVPAGPLVNSPLLWVAAAASRREFETDARPAALATATVDNHAPTLGTPTVGTPNTGTGVVTGSIKGADTDKDALTYSADPLSTKGATVVVNATTGAFTYTPTAAIRHAAAVTGATTADKTDTFTIRVDDGFGAFATKVVTVTVKPINAAPTAAAAPTVQAPDGQGVVTGTLGVADGDSDTVAFTAAPKKGTVTFAQDGSFAYTASAAARHAAAATGATAVVKSETFTVTVTDGHGGTVTKSVKVEIAPANTDPVISDVTAGAPNTKGVVSGQIIAGDTADNDTLTYKGASTASGKVVVNSKTGTFTYTPTAAARHAAAGGGAGTDTITLTVTDGHGGTDSKTVVVSILPANANPTATVSVGKPNATTGVVTGTVKGADTDKDGLTYSASPTTSKGAVTLNTSTGAFTYTPTDAARHLAATGLAADKADTFVVTITDAHGGAITKTVTVSVSPINTAPTAAATPTVHAPDGTGLVTGALGVADGDSDTLIFTAAPKKGTVTFTQDGSFTYTASDAARHAAAATGALASAKTETFTVTIADGHGGTVSKSVKVAIAPANVDPVIGDVTVGVPNSTTGMVSGQIIAGDTVDKDKLTYTGASTASGKVSVNATTGAFTYTPTAAARHAAVGKTVTDTFTVTVSDGYGGTVSKTVAVNILPDNLPPSVAVSVGIPDPVTGSVTGNVTGTDPDNDVLVFSGPTSTTKGVVNVNTTTGAFTYTPTDDARHNAAFAGASQDDKSDTFDVTVRDGKGNLVTVAVTVAIQPGGTNVAPANLTATVSEPNPSSGVVTGTLSATDADGDTLTYSGPATTTKGALTVVGNTFTYTPSAAARHKASSGTATDADKTDSFTVTVTDGYGASVPATVTVRIQPANTAPTVTVTTGTPNTTTGVVTGTVKGADANGDTLTYTAPTSTAKGTITINASTGAYTYTPTAAARHAASATTATAADKQDTFTVTVSDGYGAAVPATVTVTIRPANTAPTLSVSTGTPDASTGVVTGTVTGTDADGDPLKYAAPASTSKGNVTIDAVTGAFTYTPTAAARHAASATTATTAKSDSFTVTGTDGFGATVTATVSVSILPANTAPTATVNTNTNTSTGVVTGTVKGADADGDTVKYAVAGATKGTVTITTAGAFTYTPTAAARHLAASVAGTDKTDSFTVTMTDGYGGSVPVTVTVNIVATNTAPTVTVTTGAPDPVTGVVAGTVKGADANGDTLQFTAPASTSKGTITLDPATGAFTYAPTAAARHGAGATTATAADKQDSFTVTVSDGFGANVPATVTVSITPANAAPTATATAGTPNALTGAVTGTVTGTDADGDTLTYTAPASTGRGTVTVNATTGAFTYTPTEAARLLAAAGSATTADKQDTVLFTVKDGYGGTATVSVTVDVAPVTRTAATVGTITVNGVAHDAYFNADGTRAVVVTKASAGGVVAFSIINTATGVKVGNFITLNGSAPNFVAFTADGGRAVVATSDDYSKNIRVAIIDATTGAQVGATYTSSNYLGDKAVGPVVQMNADGSRVAVATTGLSGDAKPTGRLVLLNTATGALVYDTGQVLGTAAASFSADGTRAAAVTGGQIGSISAATTITIVNATTGAAIGTSLVRPAASATTFNSSTLAALNADGTKLVVTDFVQTSETGLSFKVSVYTVGGGQIGIGFTVSSYAPVTRAQFSADGSRAVLTLQGLDGSSQTDVFRAGLVVVNMTTGTQVGSVLQTSGWPSGSGDSASSYDRLVLNPSGTRAVLVAQAADQSTTRVMVIDLSSGAQVGSTLTLAGGWVAGTGQVSTAQSSADGSRVLVVGNADNGGGRFSTSAIVIDTGTGAQVSAFAATADQPTGMQLSADGTRVVVTSVTGGVTTVSVLDAATGAQVGDSLTLTGSAAGQPQLSADGTRVVVAADVGGATQVLLLNTVTGTQIGTTAMLAGTPANPARISANGAYVVASVSTSAGPTKVTVLQIS